MKYIIPIVCFALVSPSALDAQAVFGGNASKPDKRDYAFWREMPEVALVIKDVQGKDEEETAARRLVAYHLLDRLVAHEVAMCNASARRPHGRFLIGCLISGQKRVNRAVANAMRRKLQSRLHCRGHDRIQLLRLDHEHAAVILVTDQINV